MVKLQDVADLAGVSKTLVSRAINHQKGVSEKSKRKIFAALEELHYEPNTLARSLALQKTHTVGVVMDTLCEPYFFPLIEGIESAADRSEYAVMFNSGRSNLNLKARSIKYFRQGRADGIILYGSLLDDEPLIEELAHSNYPSVVVENTVTSYEVNNVVVDNAFGAGLAVDHLFQCGCRKIFHVGGDAKRRVATDRRDGFIVAMQKHGIAVDSRMIIQADFSVKPSYQAVAAFINECGSAEFPDAFFCSSDNTAYGTIMALEDAGYRVPEDVMIVGFDDDRPPMADRPLKKLTTLSQPLRKMGEAALELLIRDIEQRPQEKKLVTFYPELIVRETTIAR